MTSKEIVEYIKCKSKKEMLLKYLKENPKYAYHLQTDVIGEIICIYFLYDDLIKYIEDNFDDNLIKTICADNMKWEESFYDILEINNVLEGE